MKITRSSDWRETLPFETPMIAAQSVPGEPSRCSACGPSSAPRDRTELWAVKHRHPNNPAGFVRFYCADHVPRVERPASPAPAKRERRPRAPQRTETPAALCPNCFVEIPAAGVCGMCGEPAP